MYKAVAKYKDSDMQLVDVTNFGQPFFAERALIEFMIEKMAPLHPDIEYRCVDAPEAKQFSQRGHFSFFS